MYPFLPCSKSARSREILGGTVNIPKEIYAIRSERSSAISYVIQRMVARTSQSGGDDKSSKRGNSRCFSPGEPRHTSCPGVEKRGEEPRPLGWGRGAGRNGEKERTIDDVVRQKCWIERNKLLKVMDLWRVFIMGFAWNLVKRGSRFREIWIGDPKIKGIWKKIGRGKFYFENKNILFRVTIIMR